MKRILKEEDIYKGNLLLVNQMHPIKQAIDLDLEEYSSSYKNILFDKVANQFLKRTLNDLNLVDEIVPVSGYRTLEEQKKIFTDSLEENGEEFTRKYVALPNTSEHQTGLAIDLGLGGCDLDFICPSFPHKGICEKFRKSAVSFGFIERYKKEKEQITGISAEEWHFRFVGSPHAEIMEKKALCLEEYIYKIKEENILYQDYEISYIPYEKEIEIEMGAYDTISGNNIDGFILTRKRKDENR